jgi:TolB protein
MSLPLPLKKAALLALLVTLFSAFGALPSTAQQAIDIDITDAAIKKINFAVPYFTDKNPAAQGQGQNQDLEAGKAMAALLAKGLDFHGFINVIGPESYGGGQDQNWRLLGANYVVIGTYGNEGPRLVLELRLIEAATGRMLMGKRFRDTQDKQRQMILKFCDEVIYTITGRQGISSSKIAFVADSSGHKEIYIADALGDDIRQITRHQHLAITPRLSPDSSKLVYTSYHKGNPNLYLIDFNKSSKLTKAISRREGINYAPAWAPDESFLIVTLSKDGNPDLYKIDPEGTILKRLTINAGINVSPSFSPDGRQIAFVSDRTGEPQIYLMELESGRVQRLTYQGRENTTPSWSPDGDWIAFTGRGDDGYQIYKMRATGGPAIQLTAAWGNHESPTWSPDSRQIAFTRTRDGKSKLCTITSEGQWLQELFTLAGNQSSPQWSQRLKFY